MSDNEICAQIQVVQRRNRGRRCGACLGDPQRSQSHTCHGCRPDDRRHAGESCHVARLERAPWARLRGRGWVGCVVVAGRRRRWWVTSTALSRRRRRGVWGRRTFPSFLKREGPGGACVRRRRGQIKVESDAAASRERRQPRSLVEAAGPLRDWATEAAVGVGGVAGEAVATIEVGLHLSLGDG